MRYWISTISRAHVQAGAAGGFTQADHGGKARLKRLSRGDLIVYYSPREDIRAGATVQRFTGIARILDDSPYPSDEHAEAMTWRRRADFLHSTEAPIQPLIEQLEFIRNKKSWGVTFRRGFFEVTRIDFETIAAAMNVKALPVAGAA